MKKMYLLLTTFLLLSAWAMSQTLQSRTVKPVYAKAGIKKTIAELQAHVTAGNSKTKALDLNSIKPFRSYLNKYKNLTRSDRPSRVVAPLRPMNNNRAQSAIQIPMAEISSPGSTQQIWSNFLSNDFFDNIIGWPPDPNGAVSNDQVIVATNNGIKVFDKPGVSDAPLVTPKGYSRDEAHGIFIPLDNFFSAVLTKGSFTSDPHIRYDRLSKRWFIVCIDVNYPSFENNPILLAVSDQGKITSTSSFTFYSFNSSLFPYDPGAPYAPFLDFPTLGVDHNAVLIGGNQFGYDSLTNVGYVIDKIKLMQGKLVVYPFELGVYNFIDGTLQGMVTPQAVHNDDANVNRSYFAGLTYYSADSIVIAKLWYNKIHVPQLTKETNVPIPTYNSPRDNTSLGSLTPLDMGDTRLLEASIHKNKITGKSSLWTAHAVGSDQHGNFIDGSDSDYVAKARTVSRWYEVGNIYTNPVLSQLGNVIDANQPSGRRAKQYFNPSIAASGQGHAVIGGSTDAFDEYINVFVAGRYSDDPKGTMHSAVKATNTTAIYAPYIDFGGGFFYYINRWGDFSQTVVDPADDQTIWTFQEYADVDDSYGVRAVQVKAPPPATPLPLGTLSNKKDTTIILNGVSADHSGFFDPGEDKFGPGYNRLSVKSTGSIIASNIKFISPTKISFKLNTKSQPAGTYFLIITNPDGQVAATQFTIGSNTPAAMASTEGFSSDMALNDKIVKNYIVKSGVYPNPATTGVKLQVNAAKDFTGKIILMNAAGKIISSNSYSFAKGNGEAPVSLANLSSGTYLAAVYNESNILIAVHAIVKQ